MSKLGGRWCPAKRVTRAQGLPLALLVRWQRQALEADVPSSVERRNPAAARRAQTRGNGTRHFKKRRDLLLLHPSGMNHYLFIAVCTEPWSVPVRCRLLAGSSVIYSQSRQHLSPPRCGVAARGAGGLYAPCPTGWYAALAGRITHLRPRREPLLPVLVAALQRAAGQKHQPAKPPH